MQKEIKLFGQNVGYTLKLNRKARRVRLTIYNDGRFVVSAQKNLSLRIIEKFIIEKGRWVLDRLEKSKSNTGGIIKTNSKKDYKKYKNKAQVLAEDRIKYFNKFYGFKFNKISVRNQKTRWGSCSRKGNLNFNFNIAQIPEKLSDYIIVHELCHLGEFNHSQRFWNLVAKTIPDYLKLKRELRGRRVD